MISASLIASESGDLIAQKHLRAPTPSARYDLDLVERILHRIGFPKA
jgi:hypothetical protein